MYFNFSCVCVKRNIRWWHKPISTLYEGALPVAMMISLSDLSYNQISWGRYVEMLLFRLRGPRETRGRYERFRSKLIWARGSRQGIEGFETWFGVSTSALLLLCHCRLWYQQARHRQWYMLPLPALKQLSRRNDRFLYSFHNSKGPGCYMSVAQAAENYIQSKFYFIEQSWFCLSHIIYKDPALS